MKFENAQVGDIVYIARDVRYGWRGVETFYVTEKIIKTTKTQFTVESGVRYNKHGSVIGDGYGSAYLLGDDRSYFGKPNLVRDQTEEMKEFKNKIYLEKQFNSLAGSIEIKLNSSFSIGEIKAMLSKLEIISKTLKTKK